MVLVREFAFDPKRTPQWSQIIGLKIVPHPGHITQQLRSWASVQAVWCRTWAVAGLVARGVVGFLVGQEQDRQEIKNNQIEKPRDEQDDQLGSE
jgi:hypothetical protein